VAYFECGKVPTGWPTLGAPQHYINQIVYTSDPQYGYSDADNSPYTIFTTDGFYSEDAVNRNYEDMGDEIGGNGFSKSQFFLMKACYINDYFCTHPWPDDDPNYGTAIAKNIGNLYALGHNGLICFGTVNDDCPGESKSPFVDFISSGKDFGEAFLAHQNAHWNAGCYSGLIIYALLGAGNLHAQPYIQYGSDIEQNRTITTSETITLNQPVLIQNVTVYQSGDWIVTSNSSGPPFYTHSEIVVRPETHFAPTTGHEVHLLAN
jgi:hypothetical protein